jgi:TetR/AcrR family transcriptional regulator, transcriptional repressor for nem operon
MNSFAFKAKLFCIMARTKDFDEHEVLCKAIQVFWHKGYNGTSMQDLVDGLGISRSSLYDTYTDKHTLFLKALEAYQSSGSARMLQIIDSSASAKEAIAKLLVFTIEELLNDEQQKGCFIVNANIEVAPHDTEVSNLVCRNDEEMENVFYDVIKKGKDDGEITNPMDARALARFIFNTMKGMQVTAKATRDRKIFDDVIQLTISVLK